MTVHDHIQIISKHLIRVRSKADEIIDYQIILIWF